MTGSEIDRQQALVTVGAIVAAFGAHDRVHYFDLFDPQATFVFHATARILRSRAEYEAEWSNWEHDGFRVLSCTSIDGQADVIASGVVVFTHHVHTVTRDDSGEHDLHERETIVLRRDGGGRWLAVHEHLSPAPEVS